jgi:hypothetical protein
MSKDVGLDRYFTLGHTGLRGSRLALGTMTFGTEWGWGADKAARQHLSRYRRQFLRHRRWRGLWRRGRETRGVMRVRFAA